MLFGHYLKKKKTIEESKNSQALESGVLINKTSPQKDSMENFLTEGSEIPATSVKVHNNEIDLNDRSQLVILDLSDRTTESDAKEECIRKLRLEYDKEIELVDI